MRYNNKNIILGFDKNSGLKRNLDNYKCIQSVNVWRNMDKIRQLERGLDPEFDSRKLLLYLLCMI
jgi:hypothetical protein